MAEYQVRIYSNTGINTNNTISDPTILNQLSASNILDVDPVYILTNQGLDHLDVNATKQQLEAADYLRIGNSDEGFEYYSIARVASPVTESTTRLIINTDPFLSVGGVTRNDSTVKSRFLISDGVTDRVTVTDDTWGAYTEDDPLCAPQEPLQLETEWVNLEGGTVLTDVTGEPIFVEATVDLPRQYAKKDGKTYGDSETGSEVTVPFTADIYINDSDTGDTTTIPPDVWDERTRFTLDNVQKTNGTAVYLKNDSTNSNSGSIIIGDAEAGTAEDLTAGQVVEKGLQAVRSLGQESGSILNQWKIPLYFLKSITRRYSYTYVGEGTEKKCVCGYIWDITGINDATITGKITPSYATVKNNRILYGKYNKYGIMTCSGNSAEFNPEEITTATEAPSISIKVDPRPDGKPYYRFTTINGNTEFWRNALSGSNWENVPLIYQGSSGSALTRLNFDNQRSSAELAKHQYEQNYVLSQASELTGIALSAATMGAGTDIASAATSKGEFNQGINFASTGYGGIYSGVESMLNNEIARQQYNRTYAQEKHNELSALYQDTTVYTPTVNFPYNADIIRDTHNNGVLIYKYHLSTKDVTRIDKLLTMYGYKTTQPLTIDMFYRHTKFDYVSCENVSVTGLPKWRAQDLADQLRGGIRIWHTLPAAAIASGVYTDGSNTAL